MSKTSACSEHGNKATIKNGLCVLCFPDSRDLEEGIEKDASNTPCGVLAPWGGGGPCIDWDEVTRRLLEEHED